MNTSFDNKGRMILEVNDTLKIALGFEANPEYRSHINGMRVINPDKWLSVEGEGSDGNLYKVWYFAKDWNIELEDIDYTEPDDIEDEYGNIIWGKRIVKNKEDNMKYPENIMRMVRGSLGLEPDDTSRDGEIESMSQREVFNHVCNWEGLIGYSSPILGWINQIYGVDLDKVN